MTAEADKGLEDIVAVSSEVCSIDNGVLTYRGINIDELAEHATFEEVIYLLWHGELPKEVQLEPLRQELSANRTLPPEVIAQMRQFPKMASPMEVLRTVVSMLSLYDPNASDNSREANLRKSIRLTAKIPTAVTAFERIRQGQDPIEPKPGQTLAQSFLYMLQGKEPSDLAVRAFDKALVLHADHELNASTFAARVTAATLSDLHSAITSAIGTLKGPLHGGANQRVMEMLREIAKPENVPAYLEAAVARKEKIMGFGHRVYKDGDPRAKHLKEMSRLLGQSIGDTTWYEISTLIEDHFYKLKKLKPNVDFYSASVYFTLGIPADLFTPIFACSRVAGWTAHCLEQYANNRLIRPRAEYRGPVNQHWIPMGDRK